MEQRRATVVQAGPRTQRAGQLRVSQERAPESSRGASSHSRDSKEGAMLLKLWDVGREPHSQRQWDRLGGNGPGTLHGQRGCHLASVA